MLRLIPREERFFEFFTRAADNIVDGAKVLVQMTNEQDGKLQERWTEIEHFEHEGDKLTHQVIRKLNRTFITPIDREDIHNLTVALDDVLDAIEATAARMALYKIAQPTEQAGALARVILKSTEEIVKAVSKLERMDDVMAHCVEINRLENIAHDAIRDAIAGLFSEGQDPLDVIKWKDIYETMETATDRCEEVAKIVEAVALKNA